MEGCGFVCDPFPSAQRAKFDPADCKNPLPFTILQLGLEMNRRELDTVCHPRESLPIGICAQSSFLFYVLLYRATRSVRFHIHYDYLVACLLLPPSNSARRTGRIHTHTNKRIDWLTTTQPPKKGLCEETVTYFNSPVFFHSSIFNGTKDCLPFQAVPLLLLLQTKITFTLTYHIVKKSKKKWHNPSAFSLQGITKGN